MPEKQYDYLNLEILHEQSDGEPEFLIEIVNTFLETVPANMEKLKAAVYMANQEDVKFYAHKLMGSFSFIGCGQLSETFAHMQETGIDDGPDSPALRKVNDIATMIINELYHLKLTTHIS